MLNIFFFLAALLPPSLAGITGPVIPPHFADPSIILVDGTYYAFSSGSGSINVPAATSTDFYTWTVLNDTDLLPSLPSWASDNGQVWAPDVAQLSDSTFILYFSATYASNGSHHCLGAATSTSILGPYTPVSDTTPFACPLSQGGAIDANLYYDTPTQSTYVTYKIDGNSIGHGGNCNNGIEPIVSTPIMLQQVSTTDGHTKIGTATQILDRSDADGPLVEAPALMRTGSGTYVLFFSSNCYSGSLYDLSYATADAVTGPYTKSSAPLFVTGTYENISLISPGSCDVWNSGMGENARLVFHGDVGEVDASLRGMYIAEIEVDGTEVSI
ncbi:MAG: hypothetical protein M1834_001972 [Cirrosporium novae-zelandiae]|nr:MAG: hypothetical protein M1834_001972 [Cirrosporium novae-zelandiae]